MRKRNISFIADKLLWFIILILPLLFALVFTCRLNLVTLSDDSSSLLEGYSIEKFWDVNEVYVHADYEYSLSSLFFEDTNFYTQIYQFLGIPNILYTSNSSKIDFGVAGSLSFGNGTIFEDNLQLQFAYDGINELFYFNTNEYGNVLLFSLVRSSSSGTYSGSYYFSVGSHTGYITFMEFISNIYWDYEDVFYLDLHYQYIDSSNIFDFDGFRYSTLVPVYSSSNTTYSDFFGALNYSLDNWFIFGSNDIIYNAWNSIFGSNGVLPIFVEGSFVPKYLTYMAWIYVLHLAFDFLVFIPRLAHKWMGGVYKDEDS